MKKLLTLGMAAALLAVACAAQAYPTLVGPTGLILAPTALVIAPQTFNVAVDYLASKNHAAEVDQKDTYPIRALYGVVPGLEFGAGYDANVIQDEGVWDINAKYAIPYNCPGNVKTAIGVIYAQSNTIPAHDNPTPPPATIAATELKITDVYLVGTDYFNFGRCPVGVTLGVNWTQFELQTKNSGWRVQFGVDVPVNQCIGVVADVQTIAKMGNVNGLFEGQKTLWSGGVRYLIMPQLSAQAGVTNGLFIADSNKANFFIGVNYLFNPCAK